MNELKNDDDKEILIKDVSFAHYPLSFVVRVMFREYDLMRGWESFVVVAVRGLSLPFPLSLLPCSMC